MASGQARVDPREGEGEQEGDQQEEQRLFARSEDLFLVPGNEAEQVHLERTVPIAGLDTRGPGLGTEHRAAGTGEEPGLDEQRHRLGLRHRSAVEPLDREALGVALANPIGESGQGRAKPRVVRPESGTSVRPPRST